MTVLCLMAAVILAAPSSCVAEHEHCTSGPGWRSECTERRTGLPSGDRFDNPDRLSPPGVDRVRVGVEPVPAMAPPAPPTPAGVTDHPRVTPAGLQDRAVFIGGWRPRTGRGERDECGAPWAPQAPVGTAERGRHVAG